MSHGASGYRWPVLLLPIDALILYLAFVGAAKISTGLWLLSPADPSHTIGFGVSLLVYLLALLTSGIYRISPHEMHMATFIRLSAFILAAPLLFISLTYFLTPNSLLPRGQTAAHGIFTLVGLVGYRVVWRQAFEQLYSAAPLISFRENTTRPSLQIQDVLPREPVALYTSELRDYLSGRTVLVTGAGGSIGSELSRQLLSLRPFRLILIDNNEFNLFQLENALRRTAFEGELDFTLADVRDQETMEVLFSRFRPNIVLHAAAYKHVPLMERHPIEAFRNNSLATVQLLRLCDTFNVEQFVFVSTDKAVEPSSVLGATKRLAEWYVQASAGSVRRKIVRFGNVFASQGSVVPLFEEQILAGEPLMLTHPEMERYFMSAEEACTLILSTLLLDVAPIFIFEMGPSIRISWLAEQIIRRLRPDTDPARLIRYAGIRPGEKLRERLWDDAETPVPTSHPHIVGLLQHRSFALSELDAHLSYLESLARQGEPAALRLALFDTALPEAPGRLVRVASRR